MEVTIPVEKADLATMDLKPGDPFQVSVDAKECITNLRKRAGNKSIYISRSKGNSSRYKDMAWYHIRKYCSEWFEFEVHNQPTDIIVTDQVDESHFGDGRRVLVVHDDIICAEKHDEKQSYHVIGNICQPVGPFKLARSLLALMDKDISKSSKPKRISQSDMATQTPTGTPQEITMMHGIIMTDYGFTPQMIAYENPVGQVSQEITNRFEPKAAHDESSHIQSIAGDSSMLKRYSDLTLQQPVEKPADIRPVDGSTAFLENLKLPPAKATTPSMTPSSLRILAVDDNALNLQLLHRYLLKRKSDVIILAQNGLEALEAVRNIESGAKFDIIFMDISMPVMDGFEATRLIRAYERSAAYHSSINGSRSAAVKGDQSGNPGNPGKGNSTMVKSPRGIDRERAYIVALTGLGSRRDRNEAEDSGFDDFLTKPTPFKKIGVLLNQLSKEKEERASSMQQQQESQT